jgi:hypothetical protein
MLARLWGTVWWTFVASRGSATGTRAGDAARARRRFLRNRAGAPPNVSVDAGAG